MKKITTLLAVILSCNAFAQSAQYTNKLNELNSSLATARANPEAYRAKGTSARKMFDPMNLSGDYVMNSSLSAVVEQAYCKNGVLAPYIKIRININSKDVGKAGYVYLGYSDAGHTDGWYMTPGGGTQHSTNDYMPPIASLPAGNVVYLDVPVPGFNYNLGPVTPFKLYAGYGVLSDADQADIQAKVKQDQQFQASMSDPNSQKYAKMKETMQLLQAQKGRYRFDAEKAVRNAIENNFAQEHKAQFIGLNTDWVNACNPVN